MRPSPVDLPLDGPAEAELEPLVAAVEQGLLNLTASLRGRDALRIEQSVKSAPGAVAPARRALSSVAPRKLAPPASPTRCSCLRTE